MKSSLGYIALVLITAGFSPGIAVAETTTITGQAPCTPAGSCQSFSSTSGEIAPLRVLSFLAPAKGTALVSFDGEMQCVNNSLTVSPSFGVVDVIAQIVTSEAGVPKPNGPGAARFPMRLVSNGSYSVAVNLHTSRVIKYNSGGLKVVAFNMVKNRVDSGMQCTVNAAAFSVVYSQK